ncbi:MAG TPA: TlpA disulfide reductase family protein, partial [Burkholderiales bacterium]|nr:TlpA disulfide reductase family protein [Burkholderiales bacterium]
MPAASALDEHLADGSAGVRLFLSGDGALELAPPETQSVAFEGVPSIDTQSMGALAWQPIGTYTVGLAAPFVTHGAFQGMAVARAANTVQSDTQFRFVVMHSGSPIGTFDTETKPLTTDGQRFLVEGVVDASFNAQEKIDVQLFVKSVGGGGELDLGKRGSIVVFPGNLVTLGQPTVSRNGDVVIVEGPLSAPFGVSSVRSADLLAYGPFPTEGAAQSAAMAQATVASSIVGRHSVSDGLGGQTRLRFEWNSRDASVGHYGIAFAIVDSSGREIRVATSVGVAPKDGLSGFLSGASETLGFTVRPSAAAPFSVTDYKGEKVTLSELRGKVVVLDFFATWCVACHKLIPA